jgi:hypothetical protein
MVKTTAPIRFISFILLTASTALCQERASADLSPRLQDVSPPPEIRRQQMSASNPLPDVPSRAQTPAQADRYRVFVHEVSRPLTVGSDRLGAPVLSEIEPGHAAQRKLQSSPALYREIFTEKVSSAFWDKYMHSPLLEKESRPRVSVSGSLMGRAAYAASRLLVTRDDFGRVRLNTQYLLGVLSSIAVHPSDHSYRARSTSATFNDFGSTIGSGAGLNVLHAFEPEIRHMVKGLTPKFVSKIEGRAFGGLASTNVVAIAAR